MIGGIVSSTFLGLTVLPGLVRLLVCPEPAAEDAPAAALTATVER